MDDSNSQLITLTNDHDFKKLSLKLREVNPVKIITNCHSETGHSNVLAWLLDPNQEHKLQTFFLKSIIKDESRDYSDFEVIREKVGRMDIVGIDSKNPTLLAIENKLKSTESEDQLTKYLSYIHVNYPEHEKFLYFLTLNGEYPSVSKFERITYNELLETLRESLKQGKLHQDTKKFISYYISLLEEICIEGDFKRLCEQIVANHKKIDDIIEYINKNKTMVTNVITKQQEEALTYIKEYIKKRDTFLKEKVQVAFNNFITFSKGKMSEFYFVDYNPLEHFRDNYYIEFEDRDIYDDSTYEKYNVKLKISRQKDELKLELKFDPKHAPTVDLKSGVIEDIESRIYYEKFKDSAVEENPSALQAIEDLIRQYDEDARGEILSYINETTGPLSQKKEQKEENK